MHSVTFFFFLSLASILDEVNIDFEPLYRCIHVYDTLGKRNEFKTSYSEDRRVGKKKGEKEKRRKKSLVSDEMKFY